MEQELLLEQQDGIATITLNRPHRLNALTRSLLNEQLPQLLERVGRDEGARVVIITGAGEGFCSGLDVSEMRALFTQERPDPRTKIDTLSRLIHAAVGGFTSLEKPVIGAINGIAAGAGFSIALLCDLLIASERASFCMAFVRRGLIPDLGATYTLARRLGTARALEICLTGDVFPAQEMEKLGLVNKVVPHDQLMPAARELALKLAQGPGVAQALTKRAIYKGLRNSLRQQIELEALGQALCSETEDFKEGVRSFLEKRQPVFKGK